MPLAELTGVTCSYGSVKALDNVCMTLAPGTIGLVGNNGAGKSTLLKVLLGLLQPDQGHLTILDRVPSRDGLELRGMIGYMAETSNLVTLLKGVEFVALSGELCGMPRRHAKRRAHELLYFVGLGELRYRKLDEYSMGNLQRLKLAAALVHDPRLLFLDEPTNGLDPDGHRSMLKLIADLIKETGKSVLLCTHLLSDVEKICDQVVVLHRGSVAYSGPITNLVRSVSPPLELEWQGDGNLFLQALGQAGLSYDIPAGSTATVVVRASAENNSRGLFEIARRTGVTLVKLKPLEEDLEQLFFRMTTTQGASKVVGDSSTPRGAATEASQP